MPFSRSSKGNEGKGEIGSINNFGWIAGNDSRVVQGVPQIGKKPRDCRYVRICPVSYCWSKPQKKLSQHLSYKHPEWLCTQRMHYLKVARRLVHHRVITVEPRHPMLHRMLRTRHTNEKPDLDAETEMGVGLQ